MLLTALVIAASLFPDAGSGIESLRRRAEDVASRIAPASEPPDPAPAFLAEMRAVSNWREEAGRSLRPASLALVARYAATEPAFVARCVRLNNYWCIKSARWTGEIGADSEGHTGFASAAAGADAAAQLLRRYYRDLGRRNALAIVRRWAPAECRATASASAPARSVSTQVAPFGLRKTLRARYLSRNTRGGLPKVTASAGKLRVQPWSARALMARGGAAGQVKRIRVASAKPELPVPSQNPGLLVRPSVLLVKPSVLLVRPSELLVKPSVTARPSPPRPPRAGPRQVAAVSLADRLAAESAALPAIATGQPSIPLLDLSVPPPLCADDETRIRNYAGRIAASVGLKSEDDLQLFAPDGRPLPNLRAVMLAMSGVELGTLRASPSLVEAAVVRLAAATP